MLKNSSRNSFIPGQAPSLSLMKEVLHTYLYFFKYVLFTWVPLAALVVIYPHGALHLSINGLNTSAGDVFFQYFTYLGDGIMVMVFLPLLLFFARRHVLELMVGFIISSLLAQSLKRLFKAPRPVEYFKDLPPEEALHLVDDLKYNHWHSFPSGHTCTAFFLGGLVCVIWLKDRRLATLGVVLLCWLVGFSRVYLSQHFLADVVAGAFLGVTSLYLTLLISRKWHQPSWEKPLVAIRK